MSIQSTLKKADKLARAGDRAGAQALYQEVLSKFPGNLAAQKGLMALAAGGPAAAAGAKPANGGPAPADMQRLQRLFQQGALTPLIEEGNRLAMVHPKSAPLLNLIAAAYLRLGRAGDAVPRLERALKADPSMLNAAMNLTGAYGTLGDVDNALNAARRAVRIAPNHPEALASLGVALNDARDYAEAAKVLRRAVEIAPANARALGNLGKALVMRHEREGIALLARAAEAGPKDPRGWNTIAEVYKSLAYWDEALAAHDAAIAMTPRDPALHNERAETLRSAGRDAEAIAGFDDALALDPGYVAAMNSKAISLNNLARRDEAVALLKEVTALAPDHAPALYNLTSNDKTPADAARLEAYEAIASDEAQRPGNRIVMRFALSEEHQKTGDLDAAFTQIEAANRLRSETQPYDLAQDRALFDGLKRAFAAPVPALEGQPAPAARPVLIVGMPRSGTTLTEQILASHSAVEGGGELYDLARSVRFEGWLEEPGNDPTPESLSRIREDYLAGIARRANGAPVVTDKMPLNFRWVGHVLSAVPEARVIHTMRDARATCWSIYSRNFASRGNGYAYDMDALVGYYRMYRDLMAFWHEAFPGRIYDLDYERLTENQEEESRKLVAAAGLDWEEAVLEFHKAKRSVATASTAQVRQKMYKGSSEAWRRYEAHLGPMLEGLEGL